MVLISMLLGFVCGFYWLSYLKKTLKINKLNVGIVFGIFLFSTLFGVFSAALVAVSWLMDTNVKV